MAKLEIEIPADKKVEWQEIDNKTVLVMVDKKDSRPVTERIKTFDDAIQALGDEHPLVAQYRAVEASFKEADNNLHLFAYSRLAIIAAALNEGWTPQYTEDEWRYYPWFYLYTKEEYDNMDEDDKKRCRFVGRSGNSAGAYGGLVYTYTDGGSAYSYTGVGSRLVFKSRELAEYCGVQFIDIWVDFLYK